VYFFGIAMFGKCFVLLENLCKASKAASKEASKGCWAGSIFGKFSVWVL